MFASKKKTNKKPQNPKTKSFEQGSGQECLISWGRKKSGEQDTMKWPPKAVGTFFWWVSGGLKLGGRGMELFLQARMPSLPERATFLAVLGLSLSGSVGA